MSDYSISTTITIPYPPSVNNYWKKWNNRIVISKEGRQYKADVADIGQKSSAKALNGPVALIIKVWRPRKVGDLDNSLKAILDALKGIAYQDDKQVVEIHAFRADDKENPRAEVTYFECE